MIALNPESENLLEAAVGAPGAEDVERLLHALNWRYAVKKFDPERHIDATRWTALEDALTLTASGIGLQPWKFFVVDDPATRARLREVSYGQPQITDADRLVVFTARVGYSADDVDRFVARVAEVRGQTLESLEGLRNAALSVTRRPDRDVWSARQAYIALGNFLTSAALLGVDACPMEGLDPAAYDDILGLKAQGYTTLAVAAAGFRSTEDKYGTLPKARFAREQVVAHV